VFVLDSDVQLQALPAGAEVRRIKNFSPTAVSASANGHRSASDMWRVSRALSDKQFDLLLFPTVYSYVPVFSRAKKVVMIHDVIAETYPGLTVPKRVARLLWKTKVMLGRWQADAIVTVSEYSRAGILDHFGIPPDRVFVVGEANDPIFQLLENPQPSSRLRALGISPGIRSVVYVGGFGPHKNLERLLAAFAGLALQSEFADVVLIMVGEYEKEIFHSAFHTMRKRAYEVGLADRIVFTGYLSDDDLVILLNLATVLVLPSLMEGFGLPAVEAAACGCPVIATKASPLPGLLGEAARYIEPTDVQDLQRNLQQVLSSDALRQKMRSVGLVAARRLTWDAAAQQMIQLMQQVMTQ
jgi:glycosyltransferase involved in cell wall biosynthesis